MLRGAPGGPRGPCRSRGRRFASSCLTAAFVRGSRWDPDLLPATKGVLCRVFDDGQRSTPDTG
eukprot:913348-Lingulodinium_polyedra.AAC.1